MHRHFAMVGLASRFKEKAMAVLPSKRQGYSFGVAVGLIASSVFVLVNQGALPTISRISSVVIWMLLVAAIVWAVWLRKSEGMGSGTSRPNAMKVYGFSCLLMVHDLSGIVGSACNGKAFYPQELGSNCQAKCRQNVELNCTAA